MKVALVNNGTKEPQKLLELLRAYEVTVFDSARVPTLKSVDFDLIVLSGSSRFPISGNEQLLQSEIDLIRTSTTPIIGICYGCELIAHTFGGTLVDRGEGSAVRDLVRIEVVEADSIFGELKEFMAYDAHRWVIASLPSELRVIARSEHGPEVIQHIERLIWGFQFHPEKMVDQSYGDEIFIALTKPLAFKNNAAGGESA